MEIRLGETIARCPECHGAQFVHLDPGSELNEASELLCAVCETPARHADLIMQIAAEALREAGERLRGKSRG